MASRDTYTPVEIKRLPSDKLGTDDNPRKLFDDGPQGPVFWWTLPDAELDPDAIQDSRAMVSESSFALANAACAMFDSLSTEQEAIRWWLAINAAMYHGGSIESYAANYGASPLSIWSGGNIECTVHNIVKSAVDTVTARISMNKPKATAISVHGTWEERLKCEGMTDFMSGVFDQIDFHAKLPAIVRDCCLSGDGILKVHEERGKLKGTRVLRGHLVIDEAEGYQGDPRTMFEMRWASRERLLAFYPNAWAAIRATPTSTDTSYFQPSVMSPYSTVVKYWHAYRLPDMPGASGRAGKGRHIVFTRAGILLDEEYNFEDFPFIRLTWSPPTTGYWGESFVAALRGGQVKVNTHDINIEETMRRMNAGRWLVPAGSELVVEHLNNEIGAIVRHTGPRPVKDNSDSVAPEEIKERDYEITIQPILNGISTLASAGVTPPSLKSGEGEKVAIDIHTQRFTPLEQRQGFFACNAGKAYLQLVRSMKPVTLDGTGGGLDYKVWTQDRFGQSREIRFGEVNLNEEAFRIRISATNMMADSPEDRTDQAISLAQAGVLDGIEMVDAINFPDLQSITAGKTAALKMIKWLVYKMARDADFYLSPEPDFDLVHGIPYMQAARAQLFMDNAPSSLRNKFLEWIVQAKALVPAPLGTKLPPPVPAQPLPPPQSQMLPMKTPAALPQ